MVLSQPCLSISRESLLAINSKHRCVLLHKKTRDVITRLQLRRRGHRAGEHHRRRVNAAQAVASSVNCAVPAGIIPTIVGNRAHNVNNDQLFAGRRDARVCALRPVDVVMDIPVVITARSVAVSSSSLLLSAAPVRPARTALVRVACRRPPSIINVGQLNA